MQRDIAAEPNLFCAYYEPMVGSDAADLARQSAASLKRICARSGVALRFCFSYWR